MADSIDPWGLPDTDFLDIPTLFDNGSGTELSSFDSQSLSANLDVLYVDGLPLRAPDIEESLQSPVSIGSNDYDAVDLAINTSTNNVSLPGPDAPAPNISHGGSKRPAPRPATRQRVPTTSLLCQHKTCPRHTRPFSRIYELDRHMKTCHTNIRYFCEVDSCKASNNGHKGGFGRPDNLQAHMRRVHGISEGTQSKHDLPLRKRSASTAGLNSASSVSPQTVSDGSMTREASIGSPERVARRQSVDATSVEQSTQTLSSLQREIKALKKELNETRLFLLSTLSRAATATP